MGMEASRDCEGIKDGTMVDGEQAFCDGDKKVSWCLPEDCVDLPLPDSETTCGKMLEDDPDMCTKSEMLEMVSFLCRKACKLCGSDSAPASASSAKNGSENKSEEDGTKSDKKDKEESED